MPEFGAFYNSSVRNCRSRRASSSAISNFAVGVFFVFVLAVAGRWSRRRGLAASGRATGGGSTGGARDPGLGPIAQKFATSQAARTLATLLGGGIPLVNAIDVSARSIGNQYMAQELTTAAQQVREGRALARR